MGAAALVAALALPSAASAGMPAGFDDHPIINGLTQPVGVDWAPNGRAFVVEKHGVLKTAAPDASTATTVWDIRTQVNDAGDRGMESVAVDKSFATNGFVYVAYVKELRPLVADSDAPMTSRLVRLRLNPSTGQLANPSEAPVVVLGAEGDAACPVAPANDQDCMPADSTSHMIGTVRADADGTLWVGNGDGASFNYTDPLALRTLDPTSLAGKILHVDRNGNGLTGHAFCSANSNLTDVCTKVHAKGFRNPFRFQVRPDKKVILGDVGWNTREEIDVVAAAGKSYGWPCREGKIATPGYKDRADCAPYTTATETEPIYDYPRCPANNPATTVCGSAVIGGPDYQGSTFPAGYKGSMFVGDYTSYKIFRLPPDGNGGYGAPQVFSDTWLGTDLEPTPDGESLAYVNFGYGTGPDGYVGKISYSTPGNRPPTATASADKTSGPAPLAVNFTGSAQDPDGDQLSYDWDFGDGSAHKTTANATHTYATAGTYTAKLTVSDGRGGTVSKTISITAGGSAPVPTIAAPTSATKYRDGDQVQLSGSATDPDSGALPASALSWQVILHHADHTHFNSSFPGVAQATFTTQRDHDADSYYEVRLTATDSSGLTATKSVEIRPETTTARIESTPTGAPVSYGGRDATAPFSATTAIGYDTTATAAASFTSGGRSYAFDRWSDGQTSNVRNLRVPATGVDLRAMYVEDKAAGMAATASSVQEGDTGSWGPQQAVDGDEFTRWSSEREDNQHWQVDLGRVRSVDRVQIDWEDAFASRYQILTSLDGDNWTVAGETTQADAGERTTQFTARAAKYVRVLGLTRGTQYGLSFWEARVLGPADDSTAPNTTIGSGPSGDTDSTSASFGFSSDEPGSTFRCKLDGGAWEACTSPKAYSNLALGAHTVSVEATDPSGNVDATPASRSFTVVDRTAPDTSIGLGPLQGATIATRDTSFGFTSPELGATFECQLDGGAWAACTSPKALTALGDGSHTFSVRAKDAAGNFDATPATRTFTVDTTFPETTIGAVTVAGTSATFAFTGDGTSFECNLDNGGWGACTSPKAYTGLGQGAHTFLVRAKDAAGRVDATPASRAFIVDTIAPDTAIATGPSGPIDSTSASFTFSGEGGGSFECNLDNAGWSACTSPKAYTGLTQGSHTFQLRAKDAAGNTDQTPATRTFTVDTVAPDTSIGSGPSGDITATSASFGFTGSETGSTFECRLDSGAWASCTSPKAYSGLSQAAHTFDVRATDAAGNTDQSFATRAFRVVAAPGPPETTIDSGPTGTITSSSTQVSFSGSATATRYECKLDSGSWVACTSPRALTGLGQGPHTFSVQAFNSAGDPDPTPATRTFTVDTVAPDTSITSGPSGEINATSASFGFSSEAGATFECKLDGGSWVACTSPKAVTALGDGSHTFSARAKDAAGNTDATPATRSFSVDTTPLDTTPPDTTISSGPTGDITATSASFGFSSEAGATFECRLDSGAWSACSSPKTFSGLSVAAHTVQVRARDASGNYDASPASRSFRVVDRTAPNTTINSGPSGNVRGSSQRFTFSSEAGATFQCRLDSGAWFNCVSPRTVTGIKVGAHSFYARARDAAGNVDATPARRNFRVVAGSASFTPSSADAYGSTIRSTPGLTALYGLGDKGSSARATTARPGAYHGSPKRVRALVKRSGDTHARRLDGRNDWIGLDPRTLGRRKAFSVELWLEFAKPKRAAVLALSGPSGGGLGLDVSATGRPRVTVRSSRKRAARVTGPRLRRGKAHHLVATFDGRRLRLYVDGKLSISTRYAAGIGARRGSRLTLGATPGSARRFTGTLDELGLYDRAVSGARIRSHYRAGR